MLDIKQAARLALRCLAVITVVVAILVLLVSLYLVVHFQHPEDRNQAWLPKLVVLLGFSVAFWTILLFPLDVANQQACDFDVPLSSCSTMPMKELWYAMYIANMAIVFIAVPFCIFYYEADSEWCVGVPCLRAACADCLHCNASACFAR